MASTPSLSMADGNAIRIPAALGGTSYVINDEAGTVNYLDKALCEREDLDALIENPNKYFWEKGMGQKVPLLGKRHCDCGGYPTCH